MAGGLGEGDNILRFADMHVLSMWPTAWYQTRGRGKLTTKEDYEEGGEAGMEIRIKVMLRFGSSLSDSPVVSVVVITMKSTGRRN